MARVLCLPRSLRFNHFRNSASKVRWYASPVFNFPEFENDPILTFAPGSQEREDVIKAIEQLKSVKNDIPCVIGGKEFRTAQKKEQLCPYKHNEVVAEYYYADKTLIEKAIDVALESRKSWEAMSAEDRLSIFWKAADLCSGKYRPLLLASTMIGQGKTVHQAEIDATCELIDFLKYGVQSAMQLYSNQPKLHNPGWRNRIDYRGLEGFIATISPFNFSAIGGCTSALPTAMGNVTLWKPSDTAILSNYIIFQILREAGLPDGVLNFVPADGPTFGDIVTTSPHLAGINFTGSAKTFKWLWKQVGVNVDKYRTFPRLVGECGGKNYHYVHPDFTDIATVINTTVRSAFEYQGQKCSACSRMYVPDTLWPQIREGLVDTVSQIKMGSPEDFTSFMTAVIDSISCAKIADYIKEAKSDPDVSLITGGNVTDSVGYYVEPTIFETKDPKNRMMQEEIFGPVLTVYVYPSTEWEKTLNLIDETSPYGLTGAVFVKDRQMQRRLQQTLRQSAGNFYINCPSTGSVVGQQPFGGSRVSGTNDKAATSAYLQRWVSPQSVKEQMVPLTEWSYPSVDKS